MQQSAAPNDLNGMVRTTQIIVFALTQGLVIFGAIATYMVMTRPPQPAPDPLVLCYMGSGAAALMIVLRSIVPAQIVAAGRRQLSRGHDVDTPQEVSPQDLFGVFQTSTIIAAALLEGAGFLNLIAWLIEQQWANVVVAGILAALILAMFPTRMSYDNWARHQLELIDMERRQLG